MSTTKKTSIFFAVATLLAVNVAAMNLPPMNPYLADSSWPKIHGGSDSDKISRVVGPRGNSKLGRALRKDEMIFKAEGPFEVVPASYSGTYADGHRVIWLGTHQHVVKLDADTLETLSTYSTRDGLYLDNEEIEGVIARIDKLVKAGNRQAIYDEAAKTLVPALRDEQIGNSYDILNRQNEKLLFFKNRHTGKRYLQFYGDAVAGDSRAAIVLKREWEIPEIEGKTFVPFAANMTFDGWLIVVSNTGAVLALSNDFKEYRTLSLAPDNDASANSMQSFVRNGFSIDEQGGIYIATKDFLARVQWTGKELSMDPALGAWKVSYASGERGSGTTPALMGYGDNEDHLVMLSDGTDHDPHLMLYWRDRIPDDWPGIPGYDRRLAGISSIEFKKGEKAHARLENSPPIMGYGVFAAPESPSPMPPKQDNVLKQFVAEALASSLTGSEAVGGTKWEWNPKTRKLDVAWMTPLKLAASICTPSVNGILYCIGRRDGNYTLEGLDWKTGRSDFHYTLGPSFTHFSYNNLVVAPNGAVDLLNWMGVSRMQPKHDN